jgi:hypothetical protein
MSSHEKLAFELGRGIRRSRLYGVALDLGKSRQVAIGTAAARIDEPRHPVAYACFENGACPPHVHGLIALWKFD